MRNTVIALALMLLPLIADAQDAMPTARQYHADVVSDVASNHGNNVKLVQVKAAADWGGTHLNLDAVAGIAEMWMYTFYSPDDGMLILSLAGNDPLMGLFVGEFYSEGWKPVMDALDLEEGVADAGDFSIGQIIPNPLPSGKSAVMDVITYGTSVTNISVYDIQGRLLGVVSDREMQPGTMRVVIPSGLLQRPGVYFVRAQSPEGFAVRKLVVTR